MRYLLIVCVLLGGCSSDLSHRIGRGLYAAGSVDTGRDITKDNETIGKVDSAGNIHYSDGTSGKIGH